MSFLLLASHMRKVSDNIASKRHEGRLPYEVARCKKVGGMIGVTSIFVLEGWEAFAVAYRAYTCIESIVELANRLRGLLMNRPITIFKPIEYGGKPLITSRVAFTLILVILGILQALILNIIPVVISPNIIRDIDLATPQQTLYISFFYWVSILLIFMCPIIYERMKTTYLIKFKYRSLLRITG